MNIWMNTVWHISMMMLIYTDGSLEQHHEHVQEVLAKLKEAGLYLNVKKCEFDCKKTKYLGFIVQADESIFMGSEKVHAIQEWKVSTTVKSVHGFLGFANFY